MIHRFVLGTLCLAVPLAVAVPARVRAVEPQPRNLEAAMKNVANGLVRYCKGREAERVSITGPKGPADDAVAGMMRLTLTRALESEELAKECNLKKPLKVTNARPHLVFDMNYIRSDDSSRYTMTIVAHDNANQALGSFSENFVTGDLQIAPRRTDESFDIAINAPTEQVVLKGGTLDVTRDEAGNSVPATDAAVKSALKARPSVAVAPHDPTDPSSTTSVVSAAPGSRFRIEILVRPGDAQGDDYSPRRVEDLDGLAFCELGENDVYAVRVVNDADHAVAVQLGIDGINMWETSRMPDLRQLGRFVVGPRESVVIKGWHFGENGDVNDFREFRIVQFPDSLAAALATEQSKVGQISAQFFAAWPEGEDPPTVESRGVRGGELATGVGQPVRGNVDLVRYNLGSSLLASVTVRYTRPDPLDLPPGE